MSFKPTSTVVVRDFSGNAITVTSGAGLHVIVTSGTITSVANVSGNVVVTSISGNVVNTSGQSVALFSGSNVVQLASGTNNFTNTGLTVRIGTVALTDASGGTSIGSGIVPFGVNVTNFSGTVAWIGGSGTGLAPFSGTGTPLFSGQTREFKVGNVNSLRGVGPASGIVIMWAGIDN